MKDTKLIACLQKARIRDNGYKNWYPYNLGYYDGAKISWDCWNLVKSIDWTDGAIVDNYIVGHYALYDPNASLGDWTGREILDHCSDVSGNMANIVPGEFLLYEGDSHAGVYIGDGHVIECTVGWGQNGVIQSDIDSLGRSFFRGVQRGRWYRHGKLPFVEYGEPYPIFKVGDKVTINEGAKVYGTIVYFASWVYETVLTVKEQTGDRVVVYDGEYCIGAVSAYDVQLYEEPMHPGTQFPPEDEPPEEPTPEDPPEDEKPPASDDEDTELDKEVGWFKKFITDLIRGLLEVIRDVFKPKEKT